MVNIDYKDLKNVINKCVSSINFPTDVKFKVDFNKLVSLSGEYGLTPISLGLNSKMISPEMIPYLSEYFLEEKLSWINEGKSYTVLTFFSKEDLTEEALEVIKEFAKNQSENPSLDRVAAMSDLVAKFPCYFATIVSYATNDPQKMDKLQYVIICRANKVVIKNDNYKYNAKDMT